MREREKIMHQKGQYVKIIKVFKLSKTRIHILPTHVTNHIALCRYFVIIVRAKHRNLIGCEKL